MYLTNQGYNLSKKFNFESLERYPEENLEINGWVKVDHFRLVDDCVVINICIITQAKFKDRGRFERNEQTHTISKSLLVRLGYYKF